MFLSITCCGHVVRAIEGDFESGQMVKGVMFLSLG